MEILLINRLLAKTERLKSGCTVWTGARHRDGHGKVNIDGKIVSTHRAMYAAINGEIPAGKHVLHRCGIAACINYEHLYLGNDADNTKDKIDHGTLIAGENTPWHKLSALQVEIIRRIEFYRGGKRRLANYLGVTPSSISNVLAGKSWKSC